MPTGDMITFVSIAHKQAISNTLSTRLCLAVVNMGWHKALFYPEVALFQRSFHVFIKVKIIRYHGSK